MSSGNNILNDIRWVDGATYSLEMNGADKAGNNAKSVKLSQISHDITPPIITIDNINNNKHIRINTLSYTLSRKG